MARAERKTVAGERYTLNGDRWLHPSEPFAITQGGMVSYRTLPITPRLIERASEALAAFKKEGIV